MLSPVPGPTSVPSLIPSSRAARRRELAGGLARAEHGGQQRRVEIDQVEHPGVVALVASGPPSCAGGVAAVRGAAAAETLGNEVVGEAHRAGGGGRGRLVPAQPGPAGGRERRHGHQPDALRPRLAAPERRA